MVGSEDRTLAPLPGEFDRCRPHSKTNRPFMFQPVYDKSWNERNAQAA